MKYFSNKSYFKVHWAKQNITLHVLNFTKMEVPMFIHLYGFSMHQIFKMKQPTLGLLRKTKNSQLLAYLNDPDVFLLVKNYQVYVHSSNLLKTQNCNFTNDEKNEVLTLTNTLLPQVKTCNDNTLIQLIFTQRECAKINSARSRYFSRILVREN